MLISRKHFFGEAKGIMHWIRRVPPAVRLRGLAGLLCTYGWELGEFGAGYVNFVGI